MNRILNIVTDQKFIDRIIERHDALDSFSEHDYVLIGEERDLKFIKSNDRIKFIKETEFLDFLKKGDFSGIFLHNLFSMPLTLTPQIPQNIKVFWKIWGFDIYGRPKNQPFVDVKCFHRFTQKYVDQNQSLFYKLKCLLKTLLGVSKRYYKSYYKAVQRVDYVAGVLPFEYDLIKNAHPDLKLCRFDYSYSNLNDLISKKLVEPNKGNSIMVGNSADLTNNHLDVFAILEKIQLNSRDIYVPLSYSGSPNYVKKIIESGKSLFHSKFKPLTSFISLDEYKKILRSCGYCIFYHERQQAVGNIELMLQMGSKVFLSETNPTYNYYKSLGVYVFSIQKDLNLEGLSTPLTVEQVQKNISILRTCETIETETEKLRVLSALCSE